MDENKNINYVLGRQKAAETALAKRTGWEALGSEIVHQAIKDYKSKWTSTRELYRIRKFFYSNWFKVLSDLDPKYIVRKLDEYRREHGYIVIDDNGSRNTNSGNTNSPDALGGIRAKKG